MNRSIGGTCKAFSMQRLSERYSRTVGTGQGIQSVDEEVPVLTKDTCSRTLHGLSEWWRFMQ